jgi:hypothetical protein
MFISDFLVSEQSQPASCGHKAARRRNAAATAWEETGATPAGPSAGGLALVTVATVMGACIGALPVKFDLSWLLSAGCWTIAAFYLMTAAHWLRAMVLERDVPAAHRP